MDIFVKYPDSDTLHHFRTGDDEESNDAAKFRATVLNGRRDLILTDSAGNVLDAAEPVVAEPVVAEPVVAEPVIAEPVVAEPVVAEPVAEEGQDE